MSQKSLEELIDTMKGVFEEYKKRYPEIKVDRDYFPFKVTEEWGECMQAYLMLTSRGRDKGLSEKERRENLEKEFADTLGFLFLFAESEEIDIEKVVEKKWGKANT